MYHISEHDSSVSGDVDGGGGADGGDGRHIERPKDDSFSPPSDEEIYEWPATLGKFKFVAIQCIGTAFHIGSVFTPARKVPQF